MSMKQIEIDVEVNAAIEGGRRSFSETENTILRRLLLREQAPVAANTVESAVPVFDGVTERTTGRWLVEVSGRRVAAANLKGAYRTLLLLFSEHYPDFLQKFAEEKARSRRFVAKSPEALYLKSPQLAKQHAQPLVDGWYFDTNLSTDQVARRIRIAARLCGLRYGTDARVLNHLEQI